MGRKDANKTLGEIAHISQEAGENHCDQQIKQNNLVPTLIFTQGPFSPTYCCEKKQPLNSTLKRWLIFLLGKQTNITFHKFKRNTRPEGIPTTWNCSMVLQLCLVQATREAGQTVFLWCSREGGMGIWSMNTVHGAHSVVLRAKSEKWR